VRDVLVVRWVDRLGRNYEDVCDTNREFMRRGVVIRTVINNFTFDGATKDPMQQAVRDALIGFMAATAQAPQAGLHSRSIGRARICGARQDTGSGPTEGVPGEDHRDGAEGDRRLGRFTSLASRTPCEKPTKYMAIPTSAGQAGTSGFSSAPLTDCQPAM
jgi:hypothetical protein